MKQIENDRLVAPGVGRGEELAAGASNWIGCHQQKWTCFLLSLFSTSFHPFSLCASAFIRRPFFPSFFFMEMMRQERAGRWDGLCTRNHNGRRGGKGSHAIGPPNGQWLRRFHGPMLFRLQRRAAVAVAKRQRGYQIYPSNPPQSFVNTFEFYRINLNS